MKRTQAAALLAALLLGCPGMLGDDSPCADAWSKRQEANKAADYATMRYEGACRQVAADKCASLPEYGELERALRKKTEANQAADLCSTAMMRSRMGRM